MRKLLLFTLLVVLVSGIGCAKSYHGQYINAKVRYKPTDEFLAGEFVVLAFENPKVKGPEDWEFEFWAFRNDSHERTFKFHSRIVAGMRTFYISEIFAQKKSDTIASFQARPNYDRVRERLTAYIVGGE